jgi:hypothetical protein
LVSRQIHCALGIGPYLILFRALLCLPLVLRTLYRQTQGNFQFGPPLRLLIAAPMAEHHRHGTFDLPGTVMVSLCRFRAIALYVFAGYRVVPVL